MMEERKNKWQEDTDPRQKDDRSELLKKTADAEKDEESQEEKKDEKEEPPMIWGTGSDGGAAGDGSDA